MRTFSIILGNGQITLGALSLVLGSFIFGWWAGMNTIYWYLEKEYNIIPKSKK